MEQKQKDSLDMFKRVHKYVKTDTIAVSGTRPGLITAIEKLKKDAIDPIDKANGQFSMLLSGYAANKQAKRNVVDSLLFGITSGVYSYATAKGDLTLQGKMKYALTTIQGITDESIADTVNTIVGIVNDLLAVPGNTLGDYGVDAGGVTDLTNARDAFADIESEPEEMIEQRKTYKLTINEKVKLGKQILLHEADTAANTLMNTQKEWWSGYHNMRVNISTGHRFNLIEGNIYSSFDIVPLGAKPKGLFGVRVEATHESGKVYSTTSDVDGHYKLQGVLGGNFSTIKYSLAAFNDVVYGSFKLVRGHVVEKDVVMTPTDGKPVIN